MNHNVSLHREAERVRLFARLITDDLTVARLLAYADELEEREECANLLESMPV